jgi:hypothetical protein
MTQSKDLTAEAHRRGAAPGRGYAVARWLSQVFHPVVLGIVSLCIVGFIGVLEPPVGLGWTSLALALQVIPVVAFFNIRLRQGAYSDDDVSVRHQRTELYLFGLATVLVGLALLSLLGAPSPRWRQRRWASSSAPARSRWVGRACARATTRSAR